ncbi:MAG: threonyl-tRNA synthetase, partial [Halothiobacillaceae bacterium]
MPVITLPDGSQRQFDQAVTVFEVAASIGAGLAKAALAGRVAGRLVDLSHSIKDDVELAIITDKSDEALEIIRHSTAHLLAQAVKSLYPKVQVTIGPVVENGFYYDFTCEERLSIEDFARIEAKMEALVQQNLPVTRQEMSREAAIEFFRS